MPTITSSHFLLFFFCCLSLNLLVQTASILLSFCTSLLCSMRFLQQEASCFLNCFPSSSLPVLVSHPFQYDSFYAPQYILWVCVKQMILPFITLLKLHRASSPWSPYLTHSVPCSYVAINKKSVLEAFSYIGATKLTFFFFFLSMKWLKSEWTVKSHMATIR